MDVCWGCGKLSLPELVVGTRSVGRLTGACKGGKDPPHTEAGTKAQRAHGWSPTVASSISSFEFWFPHLEIGDSTPPMPSLVSSFNKGYLKGDEMIRTQHNVWCTTRKVGRVGGRDKRQRPSHCPPPPRVISDTMRQGCRFVCWFTGWLVCFVSSVSRGPGPCAVLLQSLRAHRG